MQARIEELERRLEEQQAQKTAQEEQVALLEKSYEIAARYMNGGQAPEAPRQKPSVSGKATFASPSVTVSVPPCSKP